MLKVLTRHPRSRRHATAVLAAAAVFSLPIVAPLAAQSVTYSQGTFNQADWDEVVLLKTGGFQEAINVVSAGAGWEINQSRGVGGAGELRVAEINRLFTYDPSVNGALSALSFSFDLFGVSSVGYNAPFFGFYRPVIRQGGVVYSVSFTNFAPTSQTFTTHAISFLPTDNWISSTSGDSRTPDFSAAGGVIEFGWRLDGGGTCPTNNCASVASSAFLDNYAVTARGTGIQSTVPEPSTWVLTAAGLTATLLVARRRKSA